jgi:hypothetical protein
MSRAVRKLLSVFAVIGLMGAVLCPPCCPRDDSCGEDGVCVDVDLKPVIEAELAIAEQ